MLSSFKCVIEGSKSHLVTTWFYTNRRAVSPKLMPNVSSGPYFSLLLYASLKLVCLDILNGTVTLTDIDKVN